MGIDQIRLISEIDLALTSEGLASYSEFRMALIAVKEHLTLRRINDELIVMPEMRNILNDLTHMLAKGQFDSSGGSMS